MNLQRKCDIKNNRPIIKTSSSYAGECFDKKTKKKQYKKYQKDFQEEEKLKKQNKKTK